VPSLRPEELADDPQGDASATIAARVGAARRRQAARLAGTGIATNAALTPELLRRHAAPDRAGRRLLEQAARRLQLSARAHDAILRVGRTIADLDGNPEVGEGDLAQAVQLRLLDRPARAE
jgi:magnesium chelatase family protein